MRIPLEPAPAFVSQLHSTASSSTAPPDPPLVFIDEEPFLVELQGSLEGPTGEECAGQEASKAGHLIDGVRVGKVDLSDPKKPVLRIAHHRLEGKLETLLTPYALLRTTRIPTASSTSLASTDEPPAKRARRSPSPGSTVTTANSPIPTAAASAVPPPPEPTTRIEIAALIRRKLVFSRRPEPLVDVSSEADPHFAEKKRAAVALGSKGSKARGLAGPGLAGGRGGTASGDGGGGGSGSAGSFFAPKGSKGKNGAGDAEKGTS